MLNHCEIMGRLVADPDARRTPSAMAVTTFTLASSSGQKREDGSEIVDFIDCVSWGKTAETVARCLCKGRLVVVEGSVSTSTFTAKDGQKRRKTEVKVSHVHFADSKPKNEESADQVADEPEVLDADQSDLPL